MKNVVHLGDVAELLEGLDFVKVPLQPCHHLKTGLVHVQIAVAQKRVQTLRVLNLAFAKLKRFKGRKNFEG